MNDTERHIDRRSGDTDVGYLRREVEQLATRVNAIDGRQNAHEMVCAERWRQSRDAVRELKNIVIGSAGTLIVGMAGVILTLITSHH